MTSVILPSSSSSSSSSGSNSNSTAESIPLQQLRAWASSCQFDLSRPQVATHLDSTDNIPSLQDEFNIPTEPLIDSYNTTTTTTTTTSSSVVYLCGNSLGLLPKRTTTLIMEELDVWSHRGVMGHFHHPFNRPWVSIDESVTHLLSPVVGANSINEVAAMGSLTNNLHLLMVAFYCPTSTRYKILIEAKAFPSDTYAVSSQVSYHGYNPKDAVITLAPRSGEYTLRMEDIQLTLKNQGHEIALCLFSGVQYYTGQLFNIPLITSIAQDQGCVVGWDLAHAVGNVPLHLHDWNVDFAAWCSYKYLNSGPGGLAGLFVHDKHASGDHPRFAGWWGHDKQSRFTMPQQFNPIPGAQGFQLSNPSVLTTVALLGSLQVYSKTSMKDLRSRSLRLTCYLEYLIDNLVIPLGSNINYGLTVITPRDPEQRGAQLSLLFANMTSVSPLMKLLQSHRVVVDEREPNVIRVAPTPLYNTYTDVRRFIDALINSLQNLAQNSSSTTQSA